MNDKKVIKTEVTMKGVKYEMVESDFDFGCAGCDLIEMGSPDCITMNVIANCLVNAVWRRVD